MMGKLFVDFPTSRPFWICRGELPGPARQPKVVAASLVTDGADSEPSNFHAVRGTFSSSCVNRPLMSSALKMSCSRITPGPDELAVSRRHPDRDIDTNSSAPSNSCQGRKVVFLS